MKARHKDTGEIIELAEEGIISRDGRKFCWYQVELIPEPIDECKPSLPSTLDEAAEEYAYNNWEDNDYHTGASEGLPFDAIGHTEKCFKAGAGWMARQGVQDSIEGTICGRVHDHVNVKFPDWIGQTLEPKSVSHIPANVKNYNIGDAVIVQIRKKQ